MLHTLSAPLCHISEAFIQGVLGKSGSRPPLSTVGRAQAPGAQRHLAARPPLCTFSFRAPVPVRGSFSTLSAAQMVGSHLTSPHSDGGAA